MVSTGRGTLGVLGEVGWGVPVERPKPKARGLGTMMHCREVLVAGLNMAKS